MRIKHSDKFWTIYPLSSSEKKLFQWEKNHHLEFYKKYGKGIYLIFNYTVIGVYHNVEEALNIVCCLNLNEDEYILMVNTGNYMDYRIIQGYDDTYIIEGEWDNPKGWCKMTSYNTRVDIEKHIITYEFKECVDRIITDVIISNNEGRNLPCKALWDTGATYCGLTQRFIDELHLSPVETDVDMATSGGTVKTDVYLTGLSIPNAASLSGLKTIRQEVDDCDFVIGMNFISQGDFSIKNVNGKTVVSFTYPPQYILNEIKNKQIY